MDGENEPAQLVESVATAAPPLGTPQAAGEPANASERPGSGHDADTKQAGESTGSSPVAKLAPRLESPETPNWPVLASNSTAGRPPGKLQQQHRPPASETCDNEPLLDGFVLLRLAQLLNLDVYYIGHQQRPASPSIKASARKMASESRQQLVGAASERRPTSRPADDLESALEREQSRDDDGAASRKRNLMDELATVNPLEGLAERHPRLGDLLRVARICLSLVAIMISVDKTISSLVLCLISRPDIKRRPGNIGLTYEASDVTMSWLVLILLNCCSMYILFSTVFNGHLLWALLGQRLFLVSRRFQYKTMLSMLVFIYLEYIVNISFVNNLFGWSFESDGPESGPGGSWHRPGGPSAVARSNASGSSPADRDAGPVQAPVSLPNHGHGIHQSYSVLSNLETFVTEKDEANLLVDICLTVFQFARGIIRMGPYITINYVTLCLNEHIKTIRNQTLLTESLKRKQKLRMVVTTNRRAIGRANSSMGTISQCSSSNELSNGQPNGQPGGQMMCPKNGKAKKRVIFATETSGQAGAGFEGGHNKSHLLRPPPVSLLSAANLPRAPSPTSLAGSQRSASSLSYELGDGAFSPGRDSPGRLHSAESSSDVSTSTPASGAQRRNRYLDRIKDFDELESYITNLYIFTGRLNRLMSRQGLAMFFIVHNLVITATLIVPEAIRGGSPMVQLIRVLVVLIGIVPFVAGQRLDGQLEQLSKQIDRIIIQQQFISRKRDNLVRIRELLHDIRVNGGGMLNFNVETGIKYLVVAFASAFFIEQEDYKLTRRH